MTDEQAEALGRRALTAGFPAWAEPVMYRCRFCEGYMRGTGGSPPAGGWWPDFRDETGATLGVLVAQVRERHGADVCVYLDGEYGRGDWYGTLGLYCDTEAEAWVTMLEVGR